LRIRVNYGHKTKTPWHNRDLASTISGMKSRPICVPIEASGKGCADVPGKSPYFQWSS
jgi:hypothetical protein